MKGFCYCWLLETVRERKAANKVIVVLEAKYEPIKQAKWDLGMENAFSPLTVVGGRLGILSLDL